MDLQTSNLNDSTEWSSLRRDFEGGNGEIFPRVCLSTGERNINPEASGFLVQNSIYISPTYSLPRISLILR
jgi:hypothetical protein